MAVIKHLSNIIITPASLYPGKNLQILINDVIIQGVKTALVTHVLYAKLVEFHLHVMLQPFRHLVIKREYE